MDYLIAGLKVKSAVAIEKATSLEHGGIADPDVTIEFCAQIGVPSNVHFSNEFIVAGDQDFLFRPKNDLAFRVRHGSEIMISAGSAISDNDVNLFLMGSAWGVLCHQRRLMPLHCSAVRFANRAFAFTGPSGAGKSTLAAGLSRRGYAHFCDDVCVVERSDNKIVLQPMPKGLKLWSDATDALGLERGTALGIDKSRDKYYVSLPESSDSTSLDLCALYVLTDADTKQPSIAKIRGRAHIHDLLSSIYRGEWLSLIRDPADVFVEIASMAKKFEMFRFSRPRDMNRFSEGLDLLEAHMSALIER
ncbi:MAG: hypothetical protein AB7S74_13365 [Hyphomicrobium sp.]